MPALSPLDGRYAARVTPYAAVFSEFGLMRQRVRVEIEWLWMLQAVVPACPKVPDLRAEAGLRRLLENFTEEDYEGIKEIERTTNHDVKAVEYFLRGYVPENLWSWIHWGCTSEDINNTAYGLMLQAGRGEIATQLRDVIDDLRTLAEEWADVPMLSRTHGQTATPTTLGKEVGVYVYRLEEAVGQLERLPLTAKINGATGTYAAHVVAVPEIDWVGVSREFVTERLGLGWAPLTTQIEAHDTAVQVLHQLALVGSIIIDLCRDVWGYVSLGYFGQKLKAGEVGSSTMPHKVNPIDFENAEGNCALARGVARTLADQLPISRWQRDLTDSTLQRNYGLVWGHLGLGLVSLKKGLGKLELRPERVRGDLTAAPEVLTEAVQTVLRTHGHADAYDQLKAFSRGQALNLQQVREFVTGLAIPQEDKDRLLNLTPEAYTGVATELVRGYLSGELSR